MKYKSILKDESYEIEIKKSRFISYLQPCSSENEALEFINSIKAKHPTARHHCFAYIIGEKKEYQRYSDDGEPSGTAGIPMLELLKKRDLSDICVVVVRYFGGILLGANGLVRAYVAACNEAVNKSTIVEKKEYVDLNIIIDYNNYGKLLNFIEENNHYIYNKSFEENVVLSLYVDTNNVEELTRNLLNLTSGNIKFNKKNTLLLNSKDNRLIIEG